VVNYIYELPNLGRRLNSRPLGWVTDNWALSGITAWQSHGRMSVPGIGTNFFTGTSSNNPGPNFTGSYEGARMLVVGDGSSAFLDYTGAVSDKPNQYATFNWKAFQIPTPCGYTNQNISCFGNAGGGDIVEIPTWMNNWDMTLSKSFRIREGMELTFRAEAYNIWNHTQFDRINSTIQYDLANWQKGVLVQSNNQLGRFDRARNPRQMALSLRFQF